MSATIGTGERGTMRAKPSAASSSLHVHRTMSAPAPASSYTWASVPSTSAVLVTVIDCTLIGAPPPTGTSPTWICRVWRRGRLTPPRLGLPLSEGIGDGSDDVEVDRHGPEEEKHRHHRGCQR